MVAIGDVSGAGVEDDGVSVPLISEDFVTLGLVIGMTALVTVREAIALARAR